MNADEMKEAWQAQASQTRITVDAERLLEDVQRKKREFTATLFWRDVREVGTSLLMIPVWLYLGVKISLPWTWYLAVPALLWIAGFMLMDLMRQRRQSSAPGEPLRQHVESSLAQVEHQIWLLRHVLWWYLLPLAVPISAFFTQVAWNARAGGWSIVLLMTGLVLFEVMVFSRIHKMNQEAVRTDLLPRRQELETLLASLRDEPQTTMR